MGAGGITGHDPQQSQLPFENLRPLGKNFLRTNQNSPISAYKNEIDICYSISENEWNGNKQLQLLIKDIK